MRRAAGLALAALPVMFAACAIYIVAFTPDVVTQRIEYVSSHTVGFLFGGLAMVAAFVAAVFFEDYR